MRKLIKRIMSNKKMKAIKNNIANLKKSLFQITINKDWFLQKMQLR